MKILQTRKKAHGQSDLCHMSGKKSGASFSLHSLPFKFMRTLIACLSTTFAVGLASISTLPANAGTLYNGWNYSIDAFNDGSGGSYYEITGLAVKETSDGIIVAVTGGTPLAGNSSAAAADGNIGWGDLFFNFTGSDFQTASNSNSLYGVHFAPANDSYVTQVGVYSNVTGVSLTAQNAGYSTLNQYYSAGYAQPNTQGDIATVSEVYAYYGQYAPIETVIESGTYIGGITYLTSSDLSAAGLDFGSFGASGPQVIGFKIDSSLLPSGSYTANLFLECANDGIAIQSVLVPEPSAVSGLVFVGLGIGASLFYRQRKRGTIAG